MTMQWRRVTGILCLLMVAGCAVTGSSGEPRSAPPEWPETIGGDRPAPVFMPEGVRADEKLPMVILLHGFGANGTVQDYIFGLEDRVRQRRFILVRPEGSRNSDGRQYWNATPECCDFDHSGVDDVAYLSGLVDEAIRVLPVDPARVNLVGHSNGGYMSYRLMCERPELFHAMVSLAGGVFIDPDLCRHPGPIRLLHIHGTDDQTVPYGAHTGDDNRLATVGAEAAVARWAGRSGCAPEPVTVTTMDLLDNLPGAETEILRYPSCQAEAAVVLARVREGDHLFLNVNDTFRDTVLSFLLDDRIPGEEN